jgi:hypothetical protein
LLGYISDERSVYKVHFRYLEIFISAANILWQQINESCRISDHPVIASLQSYILYPGYGKESGVFPGFTIVFGDPFRYVSSESACQGRLQVS